MKNITKIRVTKTELNSFATNDLRFDPFWAELLIVPPKTQKRCKKSIQ